MATIGIVGGRQNGPANIIKTELTGTDDFIFKNGTIQLLIIENTGSSTPDILIDGDESMTVQCPGVGPVDVSGGLTVTLAASGSTGDSQIIWLTSRSGYLSAANNSVAVTGGTSDVTAYIIES